MFVARWIKCGPKAAVTHRSCYQEDMESAPVLQKYSSSVLKDFQKFLNKTLYVCISTQTMLRRLQFVVNLQQHIKGHPHKLLF